MKQVEQVTNVADALKELTEDTTLPKNVKQKIDEIIDILLEQEDVSLRVNKALHELENVAEDRNLQAYSRTQIFNIISALETV